MDEEASANNEGKPFDMSISKTPEAFTFHLQSDNKAVSMAMVAATSGIATLGLAACYFGGAKFAGRAKQMNNAFCKTFVGKRPDRALGDIKHHCLLIDLHCYTAESFLEFLEDYESGKVKERLKEELSEIGIDVEHLTLN